MCVQKTSWSHPIALPLSRSLSLRRGGIVLHCVFSQALLLLKTFGEHRLCPKACCSTCFTSFCSSTCSSNFKRFGNSPPFQKKKKKKKKKDKSRHVFIKAQTNCVPQKSSCRIHCPFVSMVKLIWTKKAAQMIFGEFFKRLAHFQSWSLTYFE